jgi:signal transduction histidine kinase
VLADAAVIVLLLTVHRYVVPAGAVADGTTWMLPIASTAVFIPQLTLPPVLSVPLAAVVTAAYWLTVPHPTGASFLIVQTVVTAALIALVRRGGRSADAVLAADLRAEAARRADEKEQYRRVHDTILSTLTMVAAGAFPNGSPILSAEAARDLDVLRDLPAMPARAPAPAASLAERLEQVAAQAAPLRIQLSARPESTSPPSAVTEKLAACVAEALRNVARHADVDTAEISVTGENGQLTVKVTDRGQGFDPKNVPRSRRGLTHSIAGRMAEVGGTATLNSLPGHGTTVILRWPR